MNAQQLAKLIERAIEKMEEDEDDLYEAELKLTKFTPSVLFTRHFIGITTRDGNEFLVTVEQA